LLLAVGQPSGEFEISKWRRIGRGWEEASRMEEARSSIGLGLK
jgi:hypothetical protein